MMPVFAAISRAFEWPIRRPAGSGILANLRRSGNAGAAADFLTVLGRAMRNVRRWSERSVRAANDSSEEVSYLSFSEAISDNGHRAWAASPFVVCHGYQHGITAHSVGGVSPGFPTSVDDSRRAVSEGLADVFGGMYSRQWSDAETAFERVRTEREASAIDLYGEGSPAHRKAGGLHRQGAEALF